MHPVTPEAIVLEIGAGSAPWPRSDVLVDRYLQDTSGQRGGAQIIKDSRPLLIAAGERLPFKNAGFDYVYCNHVLEHAEDIEAMLMEMMRVARAGFIECPNPLLELLHPVPEHRWYVALRDGELVIAPKTSDTDTGTLERHYLSTCYALLGAHRIVPAYWPLFTTRVEWTERIAFRMMSSARELLNLTINAPFSREEIERNAGRMLIRAAIQLGQEKIRRKARSVLDAAGLLPIARRLRRDLSVRGARTTPALNELLCCPQCHGDLSNESDGYHCARCSLQFPIVDGIPVFLDDPSVFTGENPHPTYF